MTSECKTATEHLRRALSRHFDPQHGSPFWLDRQAKLGIQVCDEIRTVEDLLRFGPFDRSLLLERPLSDFVPRSLWAERSSLILAESGGTTGRPSRCVFTAEEFAEGFGTPYMMASEARSFPRRGSWLFVGPSGPHVIAQASRLLARLHGALEPFSVDLDPRWARAQAPGSLGDRLYREHVLDQALGIIVRESPAVVFTTPPLALALGEAMTEAQRDLIRGIHLGGMALSGEVYAEIKATFSRAVVLPGYGNSMFGLLIEGREPVEGEPLHLDYFPLPGRMVVQVVDDSGGAADLERPLGPGETGRVVFSRLDESFLLPNLVERDRATVICAAEEVTALGLAAHGVRDPHPVVESQATRGLY